MQLLKGFDRAQAIYENQDPFEGEEPERDWEMYFLKKEQEEANSQEVPVSQSPKPC